MNIELTHSPFYSEPIHYSEYCPQAAAAAHPIDQTTLTVLHYFQQVKDALIAHIQAENDNLYKVHLIGRLYEISHIQYILETGNMEKPRTVYIELPTDI